MIALITPRSRSSSVSGLAAFTLIELLIVMAVIGVLAAMLLPALNRTRDQGHRTVCINNLKQVTAAWHLYADDNEDRTAPNIQYAVWSLYRTNWVWGVMSYENVPELPDAFTHEDSANKSLIVKPPRSAMGPYIQSPELMHCPADKSYIVLNRGKAGRVRSYSMNWFIGDWRHSTTPGARYRSTIPKRSFLLVEEHEDTISDPWFKFETPEGLPPSTYSWLDLPSARHRGAGTLSFTDGSVEVRRWEDSRTSIPVKRISTSGPLAPNSVDIEWLARQNVK